MVITWESQIKYDASDVKCHICGGKLNDSKDCKVQDHCHLTGKFRGTAHNSCNLKCKIPKFYPVIFHNLSGYDSHLFIKNLGVSEGPINCIPKEKYISFTKRIVVDTFIDKKTDKIVEWSGILDL